MFFARLGTIIAWIFLVMGVLQLGLSIFVIFGSGDPETAAAVGARYFGSRGPAKAFSEALMMIGGAVILGIFASIARSLHRP